MRNTVLLVRCPSPLRQVRLRQPVFPSIRTTWIFGGVVYSFGGVVHLSFHWVSSQSTHGNLSIVTDLSNLLLDRPSNDHPFQFQSNGQIYTCCPELCISSCPNVMSITVREQLNSLLILQILNCPNLISFEGIESAVNLECLVWILKNHWVPSVALWLVKDGLNLYWWIVKPKSPNQACKLAWWLMVHLLLICCYTVFLSREL